jgi:peptidoglycan/xylan/chitin deacetylase (PgdA/CDA1 family)
MTAVSPLRVPVLMYHEIADLADTTSGLAVSPDVFAAQLAYLHDAGFSTVTAGALSAILADGAGNLPERTVVLTFDDGYGDFYGNALPLLRKHGFTATVFQTTDWVGKEGEAKRMLNWQELAEAEQSGIEIGAHTCSHPQLDQLGENQMREELYVSKSLLEDNLGLKVPGLAYPYGYSSARVRRVAGELGYEYAYAVDNAVAAAGANRFTLPRLTVHRSTSMGEFGKLVDGQDTMTLRRDRILTSGFTVVRRARSALRAVRGQA